MKRPRETWAFSFSPVFFFYNGHYCHEMKIKKTKRGPSYSRIWKYCVAHGMTEGQAHYVRKMVWQLVRLEATVNKLCDIVLSTKKAIKEESKRITNSKFSQSVRCKICPHYKHEGLCGQTDAAGDSCDCEQ